ncbi:MAG: hypothetical protein HS101_00980 [Planctomycetia bacterium]|jgi:hypothetical protein|nr:hypothetical protein [Planctomycetia bacterium]MCC7316177.1 hypothetical protein [Planctomycetota bacterium]
MNRLPTILTTAAILASVAAARVDADLVITEWAFGTGISDFALNGGVAQDFTLVVQNPFQDSHLAKYQGSITNADYDFSWLLDEAHFDITTTHHLAQLDGQTTTSGRIFLTPSVDSLVAFSGNWQYAWPSAALGQTGFVMAVIDLAMEDPIAIEFEFGGNVGVGPPFGTINLSGSAFIPAGGQYMLHYSANVDHIDPTPPGIFGEASGEFHFTITPIPEPAAALLLALPILAKRSRRPR